MNMTGEEIYLQYCDKVSAYIRGKVENHHDAEDLVSAVFLKVYQKLDTFDPEKASISTWIYTITHNTVTDYYRSRRSALAFADYMDWEDFPEEEPDEALEKLADALITLQERERDLILLHYYKGYTLKQVADMMKISYVYAKVIHKNALNRMRTFYGAIN